MNRRFVYATLIISIIVLMITWWLLGKDPSPETITKIRTGLLAFAAIAAITLIYKHWKFTEWKLRIKNLPEDEQNLSKSIQAYDDDDTITVSRLD